MGTHTSKSSATGANSPSRIDTQGLRSGGNSERLSGNETVGGLSKLEPGARRYEIREALEGLPDNARFYEYRDGLEGISGYTEVQKLPNGEFRVYGQDVNGAVTVNRNMTAQELARKFDGAGSSRFHTQYPDTSSRTAVTGRTTYTHDGLAFKNGTYDTLTSTRDKKVRKIAKSGQITTYNGQQYGVTKKGGEYLTTHIQSGMLIGKGQKTWSGVVQQIRGASERIAGFGSRQLEKAQETLNRAIRGD